MRQINVHIDLRYVNSHQRLAFQLAPAFTAVSGDKVIFEVNLNSRFLYADYLLLIASTVNYLRDNEIVVNGRFIDFAENSHASMYASRVNFFKLIQFEYEEHFKRRNSGGRFTEIKEFNQDNVMTLFNEIMRILIVNGTNEDLLTALNFCLWEVMDNTLNHSGEDFVYGSGKGFICAQYFPNIHEVRLMIADNGKGIHKALTTHPNSKFKTFSEREAVERCIEKGVTNSEGQGFGLWATSEMMRANRGILTIHSGGHQLSCSKMRRILPSAYWRGTMTYLRVNTNVPVDHKLIFGNDSTQKDDFLERRERFFGNLDELW